MTITDVSVLREISSQSIQSQDGRWRNSEIRIERVDLWEIEERRWNWYSWWSMLATEREIVRVAFESGSRRSRIAFLRDATFL
jgi:hypothetical protein